MKKTCKRQIKRSLEKRKINDLLSELVKGISLYKTSKYPEPDCHSQRKIKVELNLSN